MKRRTFLKDCSMVAMGAVATGVIGCSEKNETTVDAAPSNLIETTTPAGVTDETLLISDTISVDVVVAGSGSAGCVAAISAAQAGASVALIEKLETIGGNSRFAGSVFSINSQIQLDAGAENDLKSILDKTADWHDNVPKCGVRAIV